MYFTIGLLYAIATLYRFRRSATFLSIIIVDTRPLLKPTFKKGSISSSLQEDRARASRYEQGRLNPQSMMARNATIHIHRLDSTMYRI